MVAFRSPVYVGINFHIVFAKELPDRGRTVGDNAGGRIEEGLDGEAALIVVFTPVRAFVKVSNLLIPAIALLNDWRDASKLRRASSTVVL